MTDLAELNRRVTLAEAEIQGEKRVSRHILRKVTEVETTLLTIQHEMKELRKDVGKIESELVLLRADLPGIIAAAMAPFFVEMKERK